MNFFIIGIGGFCGAISRFYLSKTINNMFQNDFPLGTLLINIIGCLLLGALMSYVVNHQLSKHGLTIFLTVGFLASFTTFSSFAYETLQLLQTSQLRLAVLNVVFNLTIGLLATTLGFFLINYIYKKELL
ncbi:MAG: fluoride efflux transporter CrcB [Bacteriovoracaceae bacterium]|nr:fluoride efflux transporter CrcB [Bacteriovoracaceae bacterium]